MNALRVVSRNVHFHFYFNFSLPVYTVTTRSHAAASQSMCFLLTTALQRHPSTLVFVAIYP